MTRNVPLLLAVITLAVAWIFLAADREDQAFSEHMAIHMTLVVVVAPLLSHSIAGTAWDPFRKTAAWSPVLISLLELVVVWFWHAPVMHELARRSFLALMAEQASFLLSGLLLWIAVLGGDHESRKGGAILALLLTAMHMTLLGALLALSPRPFYGQDHTGHGSSSLDDQHLGGAIMLLAGGITYLAGGVWMSWKLLRYRSV